MHQIEIIQHPVFLEHLHWGVETRLQRVCHAKSGSWSEEFSQLGQLIAIDKFGRKR